MQAELFCTWASLTGPAPTNRNSLKTIARILEDLENSGRYFEVAGIRSFVLDRGEGETVVCLHGVPASAYLYRKLVPALASRRLRGIAFDLPGMGLADRPTRYDYSWSNLSTFVEKAIEALGLKRYHLVVHDIGGPIGLMLAARRPESILGLHVLNTMIDADTFHRPWMMAPFAMPLLDRLWLASLNRWLMYAIFAYTGVGSFRSIPRQEIYAYVDVLKRKDGGAAFLKIMKGFELNSEVRDLCHAAVSSHHYPVQLIWGMKDRALKFKKHGKRIMEVAGLKDVTRLPGKHFLQEDCFDDIAQQIARFVSPS